MEYKASLDWAAKVITVFVTVLFAVINFYILSSTNQSFPIMIVFALTFVLQISIYGFCYLYRPLKYILGSDKIVIKRPYRDKVISLTTIKEAYAIKKGSMGWVTKTFGNGGLFGFYGEFRNDRYGEMTWYATKRSNYIMLETTDHEKIVLTPDNPEMVTEIKKLIEK